MLVIKYKLTGYLTFLNFHSKRSSPKFDSNLGWVLTSWFGFCCPWNQKTYGFLMILGGNVGWLICSNPFVLHAPFLYPLKTSESVTVLWCFQEVEKGCIGNTWINLLGVGSEILQGSLIYLDLYPEICCYMYCNIINWEIYFLNILTQYINSTERCKRYQRGIQMGTEKKSAI